MVHHLISAGLAPALGITALVATVATTTLFTPPPAPTSSCAATVTNVDKLSLAWNDANTWSSSAGSMVVDTRFEITGSTSLAVGSYSGLLGTVYSNQWFRDTYPGIAAAFAPDAPAYCSDFNGSDTYDLDMPAIVVGSLQFQNYCDAAIAAANDGPGHYNCTTQCGVHDYMQPMMKPLSGSLGIVDFQEYFRWAPAQKSDWSGLWSRPETVKMNVSIWTATEHFVKGKAALKGVTLPWWFFSCEYHPNFRDAVVDGDLKLVMQVVSLQGPSIVPSQFPVDGTDVRSDLQGPPGLTVLPSSSHYRTSNAITFDLGGTVGHRPWTESAFAPPVKSMTSGPHGGGASIALAPTFDGETGLLTRTGYLSVWVDITHGPNDGEAIIHLPQGLAPGTYDLVRLHLPGYTDNVFSGNNVISVVVY